MIDLSQELQAALRALHPELDALIRRAVREEVAHLHSHGSPDDLLTAEQVAALVGMSPGALRRAAERGRFPVKPVRLGRRLRWRRGDLLGLLDGHQQALGPLAELFEDERREHDTAGRFVRALLHYFDETSRHGREVWRLSLTMPEWEPSPARLAHASETLAHCIAEESGGGAWLALDVTKEGRQHVYGIALSGHPREWFLGSWVNLTGATRKATDVCRTTGQREGWGGTAPASAKLAEHLSRVIRYALKSLPPGFDLSAERRVMVTGCLRPLWELAKATEKPAARMAGSMADGVVQKASTSIAEPGR